MRRAVAVAALLACATTSGATAADMSGGSARTAFATIQFASFNPTRLSVLSGDSVKWSDVSREHTVTDENGEWTSAHVFLGGSYTHRFDKAGVYHYYCRLHPYMQGEVDVFDLLLDSASTPAAPRRPYPLLGRAGLPEGSTVTIEGDSGAGFQQVATALVAADGTFATTVRPTKTTTYRAVHDQTVSGSTVVRVVDSRVKLTDVRRRGVDHLTVTVTPAAPGSTVVVQLHLRERFGWWPQAQTRLDRHSRARFTLRLDHRAPGRAALTLADGATVLALSRNVTVGR
jgi:plastocyanin